MNGRRDDMDFTHLT